MEIALEKLNHSFKSFVSSQHHISSIGITSDQAFVKRLESNLYKLRAEVKDIQEYLALANAKQHKVTNSVVTSIETLKHLQQTKQTDNINTQSKEIEEIKQCIRTQQSVNQTLVDLIRKNCANDNLNQIETLNQRVTLLEQKINSKHLTKPNERKTSLKEEVTKTRQRVAFLEEKWSKSRLPPPPPYGPKKEE